MTRAVDWCVALGLVGDAWLFALAAWWGAWGSAAAVVVLALLVSAPWWVRKAWR